MENKFKLLILLSYILLSSGNTAFTDTIGQSGSNYNVPGSSVIKTQVDIPRHRTNTVNNIENLPKSGEKNQTYIKLVGGGVLILGGAFYLSRRNIDKNE